MHASQRQFRSHRLDRSTDQTIGYRSSVKAQADHIGSQGAPQTAIEPINPLILVRLHQLMEISSGRAEVLVALIDGPVATGQLDLGSTSIRELPGKQSGTCGLADSIACSHGTFVAGILSARRGSPAPAICPQCTLFVRPIFGESPSTNGRVPSASPAELADAIIDATDGGAMVINLSAAVWQPAAKGERCLQAALDYAAKRDVVVVAAAGNQGSVGSSVITRHPWVVPVVACDHRGKPIHYSNLGNSIGKRGLRAPGENITSLGVGAESRTSSGTSAAAPFVTGAIALLLSIFPDASGAEVKLALTTGAATTRGTVVPPLLDAWSAFQAMSITRKSRRIS